MKLSVSVLAFAMFATAPFQCAHDDPDKVEHGHDTPSQALWELAEQFGSNGEAAARTETLRRIVDRYPTSHEADLARRALGEGTTPTSQPSSSGGGTATPASSGTAAAQTGSTAN